MTQFSRRNVLCLLGAVPLALGAAHLALPFMSHETRLRQEIARLPMPFPGRLELMCFEHRAPGADSQMKIVLRLTWAPGMRQRPFTAAGPDPDTTIATLRTQIETWVKQIA